MPDERFRVPGVGRSTLLVIAVCGAGLTWLGLYLNRTAERNSIDTVVSQARDTISQFKLLRGYYAENVVKKVNGKGGFSASSSHDDPQVIPLPATMIHELSELYREEGLGNQLSLYSNYPFPNRADRTLDAFQEEALAHHETPGAEPLVRLESQGGVDVVRVAIADPMQNEGCVGCHNAHPDTPRDNWKVGDVRGVLELTRPIAADLAANASLGRTTMLGAASIFIVGVMLAVWLGRREAERNEARIRRLMATVDEAASGDLSVHVDVDGEDDIARVAQAVDRLVGDLRGNVSSISDGAASLGEASTGLQRMSADIARSAQETSARADATSGTSQSVEGTLGTLSISTDQMADAIREISARAAESANVSDQAVRAARVARGDIGKLEGSVGQISAVLEMISNLAEQTNLLALNASIEAARAGEAGRGFAVVANEVKDLARQTADGAADIDRMVTAVRHDTEAVLSGIHEIDGFVARSDESATAIAAAVEEQAIVMSDFAAQIDRASSGATQMRENAVVMAEEAVATNDGAAQLRASATSLAEMSAKLRAMVGGFRT